MRQRVTMDNQNANTRNDLLFSEVEMDKIEASLNNGVLTGTVNIYLECWPFGFIF